MGCVSSRRCLELHQKNSSGTSKSTYDKTTSFLAVARNRGPCSEFANSTPIALGVSPAWLNRIRVTWAWMATDKFGLLRTFGVRYAVSAETRRPRELIKVTASLLVENKVYGQNTLAQLQKKREG